ncbi:MAG: hypothetical protein ACT4P9_06775 [Betaproteobacteria bacterium]
MIFRLFKNKKHSTELQKDIYFKSNEAAFEYAERYMPGRFLNGSVLIGLVLIRHKVHSRLLLGPTHPTYTVKLAAKGGTVEIADCSRGIELAGEKTKFGDGRLEEGDLVAVEVTANDPKFAVGKNNNTFFFIVAKLMPVLSVSDHSFQTYPPGESK